MALWGRVIEHELGYRGEFGYPQLLALVCQFCFWQWGPTGTRPAVVGWFPRDELVPLCWPHLTVAQRYGMEPRRLLPADDVDLHLRETYAVDAFDLVAAPPALPRPAVGRPVTLGRVFCTASGSCPPEVKDPPVPCRW